ncbi:RNA-binding S4 domain-containing protein, partial [uncultured Aeromicrobium sp.]|uniref:RNA-binding S4 domain-containing protein n=1 Tax=uncultured Aeromicrobium sp. TaxID=337820 RepID=UPI0025D9687C
ADSGAHAGSLIAAGDVRVNDEVELRRGRQLVRDDVVDVAVPSGTVTFRIS